MARTDGYAGAAQQFLTKAQEALDQGDLVQASEKCWGAAAQMLKAVGEARGWPHAGHRELFQIADRLASEMADRRISELFHIASSLHVNFYEQWLPEEMVRDGMDRVRELVDRLGPVAETGPQR